MFKNNQEDFIFKQHLVVSRNKIRIPLCMLEKKIKPFHYQKDMAVSYGVEF